MRPANEDQSFEDKVLALDRLLMIIGRKTRSRRRDFSARKLAPPHFWLLRALDMKGSMRSSDIADELRVSRGAISNLTDRLFNEGLVRRTRSKSDRRVVEIELTPEGHEFLLQKERERIDWLATLFEKLPTEDLNELLRIYHQIVENMEAADFEGSPGEGD